MNILIFEDEIYNFHLLRHMLEEMEEDFYVIGPIMSVKYGIDYLQTHSDIDIIIADIQLNDGLSFDALKHIQNDVPVIFTTAYDQHALKAFEYNSLSYLLKPIDEDELRIAIDKAKRLLESSRNHQSKYNYGILSEILSSGGTSVAEPVEEYRKRFLVKTAHGERVIPVESVRYIVSENKTTYIKLLDGGSYPIALTLEAIASQLDTKKFMRVNRKYIVPLSNIAGTISLSGGKEQLILKGDTDTTTQIIVSRDMRNNVNEWLSR